MNRSRFALTASLALLVIVVSPAAVLFGQASEVEQPFAVLSFAGLDAVSGDVGKLLTAVGADAEAALVASTPQEQLKGVDGTRPWGMLMFAAGDEPKGMFFAPVASLEEFLTSPALMAAPETEDVGGGVTKVNGPIPFFVKLQNGWMYVAQEPETLAVVPADPVALLGGLEKQYDIAARLYAQRIPAGLRAMMQSPPAGGGGFGPPPGAPGADPFGARLQADDPFGGPGDEFGPPAGGPFGMPDFSGPLGMASGEFFANVDELTYGIALDGDAATAQLDISVTVVADSPAAKRLEALGGATSDHSGLLLPGSMFALHAAIPLLPEDAEALAGGVEMLSTMANPGVDPAEIEDEAERAKLVRSQELAELGQQLIQTTIRSGKLDGGMAFFAKPGDSTLVYGGKAGDAAALREVMIASVRQAQKEAGIPEDQFERVDYKGYRFVIVNGIKTPDKIVELSGDDAAATDEFDFDDGAAGGLEGAAAVEDGAFDPRKMFGEEIQVVLALKEGDHYLAFGTHAVDQVKAVIDESLAGAARPAAPITFSLGMDALIAFGENVDPNNPTALALLEKIKGIDGSDRILVRVTPAERGATFRVELERRPLLSLVVLAVEGAKMAPLMMGSGGPPPGFGAEEPEFDPGF